MSEYMNGCSKCGSGMHTSPWCENTASQSSFAAPAGYASGVDEIESEGVVVGCDSTEQTITVKISTRPSGVRIGDGCSLKWKRHPLTHNDAISELPAIKPL